MDGDAGATKREGEVRRATRIRGDDDDDDDDDDDAGDRERSERDEGGL
jgi:hypothetical protein